MIQSVPDTLLLYWLLDASVRKNGSIAIAHTLVEIAPVSWRSESLGTILAGEDMDQAKKPKGLYVGG